MGRPIYSHSVAPFQPIVRTDVPAPPIHPTFEKWSYWNPFDPDSDEFFENDPVYEAFVDIPDPSTTQQLPIVSGSDIDGGSPVSDDSDDPASSYHYPRLWPFQRPSRRLPPPMPASPSSPDSPTSPPPLVSLPASPTHTRSRSATITSQLRYDLDQLVLSRPSNPGSSVVPPHTLYTTLQSSAAAAAVPIPITSSIPRSRNWNSILPPLGSSPSTPAGPLTNPNARMSLAHIPPSIYRVRDVAT